MLKKAIGEEYKREEMQDAIRDIFDPMFEAMLQGEMMWQKDDLTFPCIFSIIQNIQVTDLISL